RIMGRRLVDLVVRYASSPGSADRSALLDEGHRIGEQYGQFCANLGMSAAESVEAFLYFRLPVIRSVAGLFEEQGVPTKRPAKLFAEVGQFLDQVLIATMRALEAAPTTPD